MLPFFIMNDTTKTIVIGTLATAVSVLVIVLSGLEPSKWGIFAIAYLVIGAAYRTIYANRNK